MSCCTHVRPENHKKARSEAVAHPVIARRPLPGGLANNAWTALDGTELNSVTCCSWHQTLRVQWPGWLEGGPGCEASPLPSYLLGISPLRAVHPWGRRQAPRNSYTGALGSHLRSIGSCHGEVLPTVPAPHSAFCDTNTAPRAPGKLETSRHSPARAAVQA